MKLWISLLTIANACLGDNSPKEHRRECAELKKALSNACSRSPGGKGRGKNRQAPLAPPQQLALAATAHNEQTRNKGGKGSGGKQSGGKGNKGGKGKKAKGAVQDAAVPANPSGFRSLDTINIQSGRCANKACIKVHAFLRLPRVQGGPIELAFTTDTEPCSRKVAGFSADVSAIATKTCRNEARDASQGTVVLSR